MSIVLTGLAVAFGACCVWLAVWIISRRERPGRRFWIITSLALAPAYPLSFGPADWLQDSGRLPPIMSHMIYHLYNPLVVCAIDRKGTLLARRLVWRADLGCENQYGFLTLWDKSPDIN
jgi:hypothetical protein